MIGILHELLPSKKQTESFCEKNWHLDILLEKQEKKLLSSDFPVELEISEWIDNRKSKIDHDYYDISWLTPGKGGERGGLFIAFMHKDLFKECFRSIGKEPEKYCRRKVNIKLVKHENESDRKSHPEWGCWLEVTEASFICWDPETEEEKAQWR